jgi:hypothetical protein
MESTPHHLPRRDALPPFPLVRYYIEDCPVPDEDLLPGELPYVDAESAADAAQMAALLYTPAFGRFARIAWRTEGGEALEMALTREGAMADLEKAAAERDGGDR